LTRVNPENISRWLRVIREAADSAEYALNRLIPSQVDQYIDPYELLGIPPSASEHDMRKRYMELMRIYHPDRCKMTLMAKRINEAWQMICAERGWRP